MMQPHGAQPYGAQPYGAPAPPSPFTCPRCQAAAQPSAAVQLCGQCRRTFTLRAGPRIDPSAVVPPFDPTLPRIVVKSAGVVLMKRGMVAPEGVSEGTLDPITGFIPVGESGIYYPDVVSIAVWRKIDVVRLVVALLVPVPLSVLLLMVSFTASAGVLIVAAPFVASAAFMIWDAVGSKAHMVRVIGSGRTLTIRFDSPMWRRRKFHDELLRRAGLSPMPIP